MKLFNKIRSFINDQKTLEDKFFAVVLIVGIFIVFISTAVTFTERLGIIANIGTASAGIMLLAVFYVAYVSKRIDIGRIMLCYILNGMVIPVTFFACGGIDSGMPLYMVAGIFLIVPVLKGKPRVLCIIISFLIDILCIIVSYYFTPGADIIDIPEWNILAQLDLEARFTDMVSSLILIGLYIVITTSLIMAAYQDERAKREELLAKLNELSKRDELTGLYNRRELFRYLEDEKLIKDGRYFLSMIDIDYFKKLNDTYGHIFGDKVLKQLSVMMMDDIKAENDEMVARYGGEEFLIVIKAEGKEKAFERIDCLRKKYHDMRWEIDPGLVTSFSGGLVQCSEFGSFSEAIAKADELLYKAKENGRNLILM